MMRNLFPGFPEHLLGYFCRCHAGALVLLLWGALGGGTAAATGGGNLTYNLGLEPKTLDPHKASGVKEAHVILNILEGLTRTGADSQPRAALATNWDMTTDAKRFVFHIRQDARWNHGGTVTADDFVYAWRRVVDPRNAATYAEQLFFVENAEAIATGKEKDLTRLGVRALTSHTLEVNLRDPAPFFPAVAAHYTYLPLPEAWVTRHPDWASKPETYLSNGPFLLDTWRTNDRIILRRNPAYHGASHVALETVTMTMIVQESTALLQFEAGKLDLTEKAPLPDQKRLLDAGKLRIEPYLGTYFVSFNTTVRPFDDVRVRQAFSMAIQRDQLTKAVVRGGTRPARGFVPPGVVLGGKDMRESVGDLVRENTEEARRLLAEAGYPNGKGFPRVRYLTNDLELHRTVGQAIQAMWKEVLNVRVDLQFKEWKVYLDDKERGNYQMARYGWIADYADPITFLGLAGSTNPNNHMRFRDGEMDHLLQALRSTVDPQARLTAAVAAERRLMDQAVIAPLYFYANDVLESPRVKGVIRNALGYLYLNQASVE
jgi:oligopeptide transport system substrate-binding protein